MSVISLCMGGVLPGGVFDGAPLTPPRGVVMSTRGNHQLSAVSVSRSAPWRRGSTVAVRLVLG